MVFIPISEFGKEDSRGTQINTGDLVVYRSTKTRDENRPVLGVFAYMVGSRGDRTYVFGDVEREDLPYHGEVIVKATSLPQEVVEYARLDLEMMSLQLYPRFILAGGKMKFGGVEVPDVKNANPRVRTSWIRSISTGTQEEIADIVRKHFDGLEHYASWVEKLKPPFFLKKE